MVDDPLTRERLALMLDEEGVGAQACASPEQAIEAARELASPLLIADFWGSSKQLLLPDEREQIRRIADAIPTIMVTARSWATRHAAADLGLFALIPTPFEIDEIRAMVTNWDRHTLRGNAEALAHAKAIRSLLDRALDRATEASRALSHAVRWADGNGLTRREREVAALVAEGLTNVEIGDRLVVTPGTVANHVRHISKRLGLRNRVQLAVWAVEHGLYRPNGR
jgi:DNA-binding NarL/FixJ family response regulator